jgi:diguanylate cyclase (GGDEF)-like protein
MTSGCAPYVTVLLAGAVLSVADAVYAFRFRRNPVAMAFIGLSACSALYALGYGLELASGTLDGMLLWNKVQYLGISYIPVFWLLFAVRFSGSQGVISKPVLAGLFALSSLTLIFDLTNGLHHFYYRKVSIDAAGPFPMIVLEKGPWYWVNVVYLNLALVAGSYLLAGMFMRSPRSYRKQATLMMIGSALPWLFFLLYQAGLTPRGLDATPFALAIAGPIFFWGMFRYRVFDVLPVAKESVFASMLDGAVVLDGQDRIVDFNPAARRIFGELDRSSAGRPMAEVLAGRPEILGLLGPKAREEADLCAGTGEGARHYRVRLSAVLNRWKTPMGKVLIVSDVTERVLMMERLRTLAATDDLTGAANRRHFQEQGRKELSRAKRYGRPLSLIIIDLDRFKGVNDTRGHEAGDEVLKSVCRTIMAALRDTDDFGRQGGDEFAILLPETSPAQALEVAERLRATVTGTPIRLPDGGEVRVTASFGVSGTDRITTEDLDGLIRDADRAMYEAKDAGRDRVRTSNPS